MKSLVKLLRPYQWSKNVLLFAALIFSRNIFNMPLFLKSFLGFAVFCCASSCVYILNDIVDREKDRLHPRKCKRPIASGDVSVKSAIIMLIVVLAITFIGAFTLNTAFGVMITLYLSINLAYSFRLKHVPILDIMCVASGFVLRTISGSFIIEVEASPWMLVCVFLLAIFLALHKRRNELAKKGTQSRKVLDAYSEEMLREMTSAIDGAIIIVYSLYCFFATGTILMMLTIPFVVFGLFRYIFIAHNFQNMAETPELALIKDKPLLIDVALWGVACAVIMFLWGGLS